MSNEATNYVQPNEMVIGERYRLVEVKRHGFGTFFGVDIEKPFEYRGIDPSDGSHECLFETTKGSEVPQWFDDTESEEFSFKIVKA